jgi:ATP-dependent Lon protease
MDPAQQNPPPADTQTTQNLDSSLKDTSPEAVARGDAPKPEDSQKAASLDEAQVQNAMQEVQSAEIINNDAVAESTQTSDGVTAKQKSSDQIRALGEKIEKAPLPAPLREELDDRIARLSMIRSSAGFMSSTYIQEYEAAARYVDWVVGMPWDKKSQDRLDLAHAKEVMDKNHYGLEPLKQRVLEYIASIMLNIKNNGDNNTIVKAPILCVVGLAGTGKTTFAKSLAEALDRQFERIPFGGMADSRVLRGQSRYFPDAEPGAIIKKLAHAGTQNPVILLDELDRVTESARADIMGVLIEILDPEQNANFVDHYIDYPFSLQNVLFIATANNVSSVATAVLDRLEIIQMPSYNDEEKTVIGRDYVLPKTKKVTGLRDDQLIIDEDVWEPLIRPLGYDPGIRGLDRLITSMCRKAAMIIVSGQADTVRITSDNVKEFLPMW